MVYGISKARTFQFEVESAGTRVRDRHGGRALQMAMGGGWGESGLFVMGFLYYLPGTSMSKKKFMIYQLGMSGRGPWCCHTS